MLLLLDGNLALVSEAAIILMSETNSKCDTPEIARAWRLFMIFSGRYKPEGELLTVIRSYLHLVAASAEILAFAKQCALVCLLRLSCDFRCQIPFDPENPLPYIHDLMSDTNIFGVSVAEMLLKEGLYEERKDLVPESMKNIVQKIKKLGGLMVTDLLSSTNISLIYQSMIVDDMNRGHTPDIESSYAAVGVLKYMIEHLQDPIVPMNMYFQIGNRPEMSQCIAITNRLPNANRDVLMYLIGFLQEYAEAQIGKLSVKQIADSVCRLFGRPCKDLTETESKIDLLEQSLHKFITHLINGWYTSDVYQ